MTATKEQRDRMVDRVRKLMAMARDGGASEGEVANALKFARKLMDDYAIEEHEAQPAGPQSVDVVEEVGAERMGFVTWEVSLASAVAKVTDTRVLTSTSYATGKKRSYLKFVGLAVDAACAVALYGDLLITARVMARQRCVKDSMHNSRVRSYCAGFADQMWRAACESRVAPVAATTAIVLRKDVVINEYMHGKYPSLRSVSRKNKPVTSDYANGIADAKRMDITGAKKHLGGGT